MKLTEIQLEAAAYIFEKSNGKEHSCFETEIIQSSGLEEYSADEIEQFIVKGLNEYNYSNDNDRGTAYWALGKRFKESFIPQFKKWLKHEVEMNNPNAVYQLLIALDNLNEPVFNPDRGGSFAYFETELNLRDAKNYLKL